jgi:hypothetical protein
MSGTVQSNWQHEKRDESWTTIKMEAARQVFIWSPRKSMQRVGHEVNIPQSMVHNVLCKHLRFHAYELQCVQQSSEKDYVTCQEFSCGLFYNSISI